MKGRIKKLKDNETGQYAYPITVSDAVYVDSNTSLKERLSEIQTAMGKVPGSYVINTERWGLQSDLTEFTDVNRARANSIGFNAAIAWASQQGYSEVIVPSGTYLIDENTPITPFSYMTINLGGATLRIRDNKEPAYEIMKLADDQKYVRITNGTIMGDRYTHDYSSGGTHESGYGIHVESNTRHILLDNLEVCNCTGDSIGLAAAPNFQGGYNLKLWEQGGIDPADGSLKTDPAKIRLVNDLSLNNAAMMKYGYFSICGNGWGDLGSQIKTTVFDMIFYDSGKNFLSSMATINFFDDIPIPAAASYAKMTLHQSNIPDPSVSDSSVLSVGVPLCPRDVSIEQCSLHHSRRCGISGGGKYIYIKDNDIHDISGTPPGAALDVEDGYGLNQYFYIEGNRFYNSKVGLSFVGTQNVILSRNVMDRLGPSTLWSNCNKAILDSNHIYRSGFTLDGENLFTNNALYAAQISSRKTKKCIISDNDFHNSSLNLTKDLPNKVTVDNCHFYMDNDAPSLPGQFPVVFYGKEPQTISNCIFEGQTSVPIFSGDTAAYNWKLTNNTFINTNGSGLQLPAGKISGCIFDNPGRIGLLQNSNYEFTSCIFKNWDAGGAVFFTSADHSMDLLKIKSCQFLGQNVSVMFLRNIQGRLELLDNLFEYKNAGSVFTMIDFWTSTFTCQYLIVDGNEFVSNQPLTAVNLDRQITTNKIFFRNNILDTVIQPITSDIVYTSGNYINGVLDPYKFVTGLPTTGKYPSGYILNNANPAPGGYVGWVCTTSGYACNSTRGSKEYFNRGDRIVVNAHVYEAIFPGNPVSTQPAFTGTPGEVFLEINPVPSAWKPNKSYAAGDIVIPTTPNGLYFKCTAVGISSGSEPVWNPNIGKTTADGTVTWTGNRLLIWKEIGPQVVFKPYGLISS